MTPVPLACSYQLLHSYVKEENIGCTLFLIRDVFELMIKIPVVIVMDGVYTLLEEEEAASSACMGKSDCMDKEDTAGTGQKNRPSVP